MTLIGLYDSPFVRRVAVSAQYLSVEYEHRKLSIFRSYDEFRAINPMVKVPTLICDDGGLLVDSTLIISHFECLSSNGYKLMPDEPEQRLQALRQIGAALVAMEKGAQLVYEIELRPEEKRHGPWIQRLRQQLYGALNQMEASVQASGGWFFADRVSQADISTAAAWIFLGGVVAEHFESGGYPALTEFTEKAQALPAFDATTP